MGEVDPAFIQAPEHRPKLSVIEAQGIPLIDLSVLSSPDDTFDDALVAEIGDACKKWGFFQVINHGVPLEKRQRIEEAARKFFAQPLEEKRKVRRDEKRVVGYYDTEHTKNACEEYAKEMEKLAFKLMTLIALSLGLPGNRFQGFFKDQTTFIRLNHYPPCPAPNLALGVGRHKDAGALTILAQDNVGGLEVKRKSDGEWIRVKPTPDAYIINVGDMIQVWSNEAYESVEHRVMVNSERERFSIPYFLNPAHYTIVKPLDELTNELNPAKYRAYNWGKFFTTRKLSNFKKLSVENIQISHFKMQELSNKLEGGLTIN
ncbi:hypothetical protein Patl1_36237 [Pistacia atlantica]|nr:hypothetical protein Patl1_36237 [Pistacia atlantica]